MAVHKKIAQKCNYLYRLCAARVAIRRMRIERYIRQKISTVGSSIGTGMLVLYATIAVGSLGSVVVGYLLGYLQATGATSRITTPTVQTASVEMNQVQGTLGTGVPVLQSNVLALAPPLPVLLPMRPERSVVTVKQTTSQVVPDARDEAAELLHRNQISSLLDTVGSLTRKVSTLEQETYTLETELLEQQLDFASAEDQWSREQVETRVIYNITNVPIGGYVTADAAQITNPPPLLQTPMRAPEPQYDNFVEPQNPYAVSEQAQTPYPGLVSSEESYSAYTPPQAPVDPDTFIESRDGMGAAELWARDAYLRDAYIKDANRRNANVNGAVGSQPGTYPYGPGEDLPARDEYDGLNSFYGPAEDRYDDHVMPSEALSPFEAQRYAEQ